MMKKLTLAAVLAGLLVASVASAQNDYLELLRSDVKTKRVAIVTEALYMNTTQSETFWPIWREFDVERSKIGDRMIALIKDYAESYATMTDEKAKEIGDVSWKIDEDDLKLKKKYYKKIVKELGAVLAVRWMQVENQIDKLIDLQIAAEIPLMQMGAPPAEASTESDGGW